MRNAFSRKPFLVLGAIGALLFSLVDCGTSSTALTEIVLNLGNEPATLDPAQVTDPPTIQIVHLLFLDLTNLRESDGAPVQSFATSWSVSEDGLVWEFHLRQDVEWVRYSSSTGRIDRKRAVNADDVAFSFRRIFDPRTQSGFASLFSPLIRNADQFNRTDPRTKPEDLGRIAESVGVKRVDDFTVQFYLTRPYSAFPTLLGAWLGRLQPREPITDEGPSWTEPGLIWTNGPYMLERWEPNQYILLRKNPYYYDVANVQIDRLRFVMLPDASSALDAFGRGKLDSTDPYGSIEGDALERVNQDPTLSADAHIGPSLCTQYFGFNVSRAPFDDVRVRQALTLALNRSELTQSINVGVLARWFTHPAALAAPVISDTLGLPFDVGRAKTLLEQAGYGTGKKVFPQVTFATNDNPIFLQLASAAANQWKKNLGIQVGLDSKDWELYQKGLTQKTAGIFRLGYCATVPDAGNFAYDVFRSNAAGGYNFTGWSNPTYDGIVDEAARETDSLRRRDLYRRAEQILTQDDSVIIPLWWGTRIELTSKRIDRTRAVMEGYERVESWRLNQ